MSVQRGLHAVPGLLIQKMPPVCRTPSKLIQETQKTAHRARLTQQRRMCQGRQARTSVCAIQAIFAEARAVFVFRVPQTPSKTVLAIRSVKSAAQTRRPTRKPNLFLQTTVCATLAFSFTDRDSVVLAGSSLIIVLNVKLARIWWSPVTPHYAPRLPPGTQLMQSQTK